MVLCFPAQKLSFPDKASNLELNVYFILFFIEGLCQNSEME